MLCASWNRVDIAFTVILPYTQPDALLPLYRASAGSLPTEVFLSHLLARDVGRLH